MKSYRSFVVSLFLIYVFFLNSIPVALACGPFTVEPVFSLVKHADYPLTEYNSGKVGVVPDTFGRMSLFVYYRELNNAPLTTAEQTAVAEVMKFRIGNNWTNSDNQPDSARETTEKASDYFQVWKAVRARVLNVGVEIPINKSVPDEYAYYENCLPDAFNVAAKTLEARIAQYGAADFYVKEWLRGQDAVFTNCGGQGTLPAQVSVSAPKWLSDDRQYQIAAALFYDGKFAEARNAFEKVAADKSSAWSKTANFVAARTYIREASFIDSEQPDYEPSPTPTPSVNNSANVRTGNNNNPTANTSTMTNSAFNAANYQGAANAAANAARYASNISNPLPNISAPDSSASSVPQKIVRTVEQKEKVRTALLDKATERLRNILTDASMSEFHPSATRLFGLVRYRNNPVERQDELAEILANAKPNQNIKNDLIDYIWLLDKIDRTAYDKGFEKDYETAKKAGKENDFEYEFKIRDVAAEDRDKDLTDWLLTYQAADGFAHAYDKWKESGKLQWLVIALNQTEKNSPQLSELLNAGDKIQRNSPAYAGVRYRQIQLLLETGKRAEAKQKLDEVFSNNLKEFPVSTQNKFLAQRTILAANLEEFLKYAQRRPALFVWSDDGNEAGDPIGKDSEVFPWKERAMFDNDAVAFFNEKMPLSVLRQAALSPQLPAHLQKFLVVATWTRSIVLRNQTVEREFAPLVARYAKDYAAYFSQYQAATTPANREAAALIAILRYPVIQPYVPVGMGRENSDAAAIDSIRGNWWCAEDENKSHGEYAETAHYDHYEFEYPSAYPQFLNAAQTAEAEREHQQILEAGNSATFLTRRAVDFAARNPGNPNTPELLHLAVRSTRYGCKDESTSNLSKQAFDILHKRFPRSEWTKKTPYWF